jgi:hypothetical protein
VPATNRPSQMAPTAILYHKLGLTPLPTAILCHKLGLTPL